MIINNMTEFHGPQSLHGCRSRCSSVSTKVIEIIECFFYVWVHPLQNWLRPNQQLLHWIRYYIRLVAALVLLLLLCFLRTVHTTVFYVQNKDVDFTLKGSLVIKNVFDETLGRWFDDEWHLTWTSQITRHQDSKCWSTVFLQSSLTDGEEAVGWIRNSFWPQWFYYSRLEGWIIIDW